MKNAKSKLGYSDDNDEFFEIAASPVFQEQQRLVDDMKAILEKETAKCLGLQKEIVSLNALLTQETESKRMIVLSHQRNEAEAITKHESLLSSNICEKLDYQKQIEMLEKLQSSSNVETSKKIQSLEKTIHSLQALLADKDSQLQIDAHKQKSANLKDMHELRVTKSELVKDINYLRFERRRNQKQIEILEKLQSSSNVETSKKIQSLEKTIHSLQALLADKDSQLQIDAHKLTSAKLDAMKAKDEFNLAKSEQPFKKEKDYMLSRILELKQECAEIELAKKGLEDEVITKTIELDSLRDMMAKQTLQTSENGTEINILKARLHTAELEKTRISADLTSSNQSKQRENDDLKLAFEQTVAKWTHDNDNILQQMNQEKEQRDLREKSAKDQILQLQNEIKRTSRVHASEIQTLKSSHDMLIAENVGKNSLLDQANDQLEILKLDFAKITQSKNLQISSLEKEIALCEERESSLRESVLKLQNEAKSISRSHTSELAQIKFAHDSAIADIAEKLVAVKSELAHTNEYVLKEKEKRIEKIEAERIRLEMALESALRSKNAASSEDSILIQQLEEQLAILKAQLSAREVEMNDMKRRHSKDFGSLQRKFNDYQSQLETSKSEQSILSESLKDAKETIATLNSKVLDHKRAAVMKNNNIEREKIKALQESLKASEQLVNKLSSENQQLQKKVSSLEGSVKLMQQEINHDLDDEYQELQDENWDLAAQLDYSNIIMVELMSQLKERIKLLRTMNSTRLR